MNVFCTDQDVRTQAPIAAGVVSRFDALIPLYIKTVSQQIRGFCNRKFDQADYTQYSMSPETFQSQDSYRFRLPEWPITPDTVFISYDPNGQFIPNISMIAELSETIDYTVDNETGWVELITHGLSYHPRGLKIEWNGGYPATDGVLSVPEELKTACALQVAFILDRISASQTGQQQEKGNRGGNLHTFNADAQNGLVPEVKAMVMEHRVPIIGRS